MAYTSNGDCTIYFDVFGDAAHPTLLLVNGLGSQCINYKDAWCEMFAAEGLQVVRYDNRDVGLSTHDPAWTYTCSDMAADGMAVLDAIGVEQAHVMGVSMGGMIVQTMAIEHPQRVLTMTSAMSTTGEPEYRQSTPRAFELLTAPAPSNRDEYVQNWIAGLHEWGSPEFADEDRWRADAELAYDRAFDPAGVGRQFQAVVASGSRAEALTQVSTPTLVLHGDKDTLIMPSGGERTAELVPGARYVVMAGMGHDYPPQVWRTWTDLVVGHIRDHFMTPDDFAELVRSRRTSMLVDRERPVPRELIAELCELAQWAPNHKRTWPWQFAVVDGEGRARLGEVIADAMEVHGDPPEKVVKARGKYLRTPTTLVIGAAEGDSPLRTAENRDAVSAGVQTVLLAATAHGLASYWGSCPKGANDVVAELCGFEVGSHITALVYLGWAADTVAPPERPPVQLHVVD